jgi:hypothetical protein
MRLRTFLILTLFLLTGYWIPHVWSYWQDYKQQQWEMSPLYQYQMQLTRVQNMKEQASQKYFNNFLPAAKAFGEDIKFLKKIEGYPESKDMVEYYYEKLYGEQIVLIRQWIHYECLLFPESYDYSQAVDIYRHYIPRSI